MYGMDYETGEPDYSGMSGVDPSSPTTTTTNTAQSTPDWLSNITGFLNQAGSAYAQVSAAKQIAKTGQVPTAQVNVGVSPDIKKLAIYGGAALLGVFVVMKLIK